MGLADDARAFFRLVGEKLAERRLDPLVRRRAAQGAALGPFEVAVHFPDPPVNLYQLRQWYAPLERLAEQHPVAVLVKSALSARTILEETSLPVVLVPTVAELETWLKANQTLAVLYVNQNSRNFTVLRSPEPVHVFCNHGESDKAYMVSNQVKAYDLVLVAGDAALRRLDQGVYGVERTRLVPVGRPQVDVGHRGPRLPEDGRTVVLYAPTWEGDRPSNAYSSVASHGEALVAALVASGRHRVIYRPHPRTGQASRAEARASRRIVALLEAANRADASAGHLADLGPGFGWQLGAADVCVTDVSATSYDWAATGKPLLLTRPVSPEAWVDPEGIAGAVPLLEAREAGDVVEHLDALLAEGTGERYAELVRDHFGDTSPGAATERFLAVVHEAIEERRAQRAERSAPRP